MRSGSPRREHPGSYGRGSDRSGARGAWLIDPAFQAAERWSDGAWQPVRETRLQAAGSQVYLDLQWLLDWLWTKLGPQG